ncbi:MAG: hypothetical protein J7K84_07520 [Deltaproteobacteria bacterium]|nr:hypothetical protein [Deltaproteobacteria bacterium]
MTLGYNQGGKFSIREIDEQNSSCQKNGTIAKSMEKFDIITTSANASELKACLVDLTERFAG